MTQPGPEHAEWLFARGHYEVGAALQVAEASKHGAQLAFIFWQWQTYCTAIEVALKAFLLSRSTFAPSENDARDRFRRRLKHDLRALLAESKKHGLAQHVALSGHDEQLIHEFNRPFNDRAWIYAENRGAYRFSVPVELKRVAYKLLVGTHPLCDPRGRAHEVPDP